MLLAALDFIGRGGRDGPHLLIPLLILFALGGLTFWFVRRRRGAPGGAGSRSALQTLQERFARGEIDKAEYDHRRAVLAGDDDIPPSADPTTPPPPPPADGDGDGDD